MGYMFRLYRVIFRPSKTTDPILQGSQVHCGIRDAYIVVILSAIPRVFDTAIAEEDAGNFHASCFTDALS